MLKAWHEARRVSFPSDCNSELIRMLNTNTEGTKNIIALTYINVKAARLSDIAYKDQIRAPNTENNSGAYVVMLAVDNRYLFFANTRFKKLYFVSTITP